MKMLRKMTYPPRFALAALLTAVGALTTTLGQSLGSLGARVAPTGDVIDDDDDDGTHDDIPGMKHPVVRVGPVEGTDNQETPGDPPETRYYDAPSESETEDSTEVGGMGGLTIGTTGPSGTWFEEVYSLEDAEFGPFVDDAASPLNLQAVRTLEPSSDPTHGRRWDGLAIGWDPRRESAAELVDEIQALRDRMRAQGRGPLNLQATQALEPSSDRAPVMPGVPDLYDGFTGPVDDIGGRDA